MDPAADSTSLTKPPSTHLCTVCWSTDASRASTLAPLCTCTVCSGLGEPEHRAERSRIIGPAPIDQIGRRTQLARNDHAAVRVLDAAQPAQRPTRHPR